MSRPDEYRGFATHYDLHAWDWFASSYGKPLLDLLRERGLGSGRVLDAGCGTGSLALELSRRGYRVTGVDLSDAMLEAARRKDPDRAVTWLQGDVTELEVPDPGSYDLVTCVADTLNHLPSLDEWEAAFRRFASCLRAGGHLFFDACTILGLQKMETQSVTERLGRTLILRCIYEPRTRRSTLKVTSFAPTERPDVYERATETVTEWGQPVADVLGRLARAGFTGPERLWTTSDDPESENRLMVLTSKA